MRRDRPAARQSFVDAENEERLKRAASRRTRPSGPELTIGDLVLVWRRTVGETKAHWHGPGHVLGAQGSRMWVAHATKVHRCSPEQARRLNPEHERLVRLVPQDLQVCQHKRRERGAGNVVEVDRREDPPVEWKEDRGGDQADDPEEGGPGQASGSHEAESAPVSMELDSEEPAASGADVQMEPGALPEEVTRVENPHDEDGNEDEEMQPGPAFQRSFSEPEPQGEPETSTATVGASTVASETYRPQRPVSDLTAALSRSARTLDFGRPNRQGAVERDEDDEAGVATRRDRMTDVLITEEAYLTESKKKRKSEVSERELEEKELGNLWQSKAAEWKKMTDTKSVRIHEGQEAAQLVKRVGKERLLSSRFVITRPDDEEKLSKGLVKARWCIRGYLDPHILELETAAPTLSPEGLAVALHVLATKCWELCIGDVEAAFFRGDNIQRSKEQVLVKPPPDSPRTALICFLSSSLTAASLCLLRSRESFRHSRLSEFSFWLTWMANSSSCRRCLPRNSPSRFLKCLKGNISRRRFNTCS